MTVTHEELTYAIGQCIVEQGYGGTELDSGHIATGVLELLSDEPTASPTRPTRQQVREAAQALLDVLDGDPMLSAWRDQRTDLGDRLESWIVRRGEAKRALRDALAGEAAPTLDVRAIERTVSEYLQHAPEQGDWEWEDHCDGMAGGIVEALRSAGHLRASGEGTAPQPDTHPETQRVWVDGLLIDAVVIYREWAGYTRNAALKAEAQPWPEGTLPGTAPQPPAEVLWEGRAGDLDDAAIIVESTTLPDVRVRVVAADGAPQEADEQ